MLFYANQNDKNQRSHFKTQCLFWITCQLRCEDHSPFAFTSLIEALHFLV